MKNYLFVLILTISSTFSSLANDATNQVMAYEVLSRLWREKDYKTFEKVVDARLKKSPDDPVGLILKLDWIVYYSMRDEDVIVLKKVITKLDQLLEKRELTNKEKQIQNHYRFAQQAYKASLEWMQGSNKNEKLQKRERMAKFINGVDAAPPSVYTLGHLDIPAKDFAPGVREFEEKAEEMRQEMQNNQSTEPLSYSETDISTNLIPTTNTAMIVSTQPTHLVQSETNQTTQENIIVPEKSKKIANWQKWVWIAGICVISLILFVLLKKKTY